MRDAGRIGFDIKGSYNSEMKYEFLDVVYYQNSSYVAKKETIGNAPADNNEFWQILARGESTGGDADASDMTVKFEQATSMTNISTGEKLSSLFGKIKKWFTELPGTNVVGHILTLTDFNQLNNTYRFWKISELDASYAEEIGIRNVGDFWAFILSYNGDGNTFHFGNIILTSPRLANNDCYKITMWSGVPHVTFSRGFVPSLTNNFLATVPGQSALDAAQGKVLNDRINQINSDLHSKKTIAYGENITNRNINNIFILPVCGLIALNSFGIYDIKAHILNANDEVIGTVLCKAGNAKETFFPKGTRCYIEYESINGVQAIFYHFDQYENIIFKL